MKLYELVTPSDPITFYAPDDNIAEAIGLFVGGGKAGIKTTDGSEVPSTMIMFCGMAKGQLERFNKTMDDRIDEVIAAGKTFAVCEVGFREEYDTITENSTNIEAIATWDERHRSSMSDWCGFARTLKRKTG